MATPLHSNTSLIEILKKLTPRRICSFGIRIIRNFYLKLYKRHLPRVNDKKILFYSLDDYSDNPRALFEYLLENDYSDTYKIVWLVKDLKPFKSFNVANVQFVRVTNRFTSKPTIRAVKEVLTSKYVFYSHSLSWVNPVRMNQLYINLWHGCGYKGQKIGINRRVFFDFCLVPGTFFIDYKSIFFQCTRNKLIPIGYPRYDWFKTRKTLSHAYSMELRKHCNAEKLIIWMPTFRNSTSSQYNDNSTAGEFGLPIVYSRNDLELLDDYCRMHNVIIVLKKHLLQVDYNLDTSSLTNIISINNVFMAEKNINLYEFLASSDALLSDYSSVAIDYLLLNKPIGFMLDDYSDYEYERGWSFDNPLQYMPGHHIYNLSQLFDFIYDIENNCDNYAKSRENIKKLLHNECDNYCKRIVEHFEI